MATGESERNVRVIVEFGAGLSPGVIVKAAVEVKAIPDNNHASNNSPQAAEPLSRKVSSTGSVTSSKNVPFSKLLEALKEKVSPDNMKMLFNSYQSFREKKASRGDFIKSMRSIVGDEVLKSTIYSIKSRV